MSRIHVLGPTEGPAYVGGVAIFTDNIALALSKAGHEVSKFSRRSLCGKDGRTEPLSIGYFHKLISRPPDVVLLQLEYGSLTPIIRLLTGGRSSVIFYCHGFPPRSYSWIRRKLIEWVYKLNNRFASKFVCNSEFTAAILNVMYGIQCDDVVNPAASYEFLDQVGLCGATNRTLDIIYVGRLTKEKRVDSIIRSLVMVKRSVKMTVIGEGEEIDALKKLANTLDVQVDFRGRLPQSSVLHELKRHRVFVSANDHEPFGIAYLEAALAGCVIACPSSGGQVDIFNRSPTQFCFGNFTSAKGIASCLEKALDGFNVGDVSGNELLTKWGRYDRCAQEIIDGRE